MDACNFVLCIFSFTDILCQIHFVGRAGSHLNPAVIDYLMALPSIAGWPNFRMPDSLN